MKLFMQGMRRSGTTFSFDVLSQDPRLDLWYEPFSQGRVGALGGGSGIQQVDLMEKVRTYRRDFAASRVPPVDPDELNHGAPRAPELELEPELPPLCRDYLRGMLDAAEHTAFKFVRLYRKVKALAELEPGARFVQLTRHPREVVASYMYGKDQKNAEAIQDADAFFTRNSDANPWNSRRFFELIVARDGLTKLARSENFKRYLLLWKYTFEHTHRDGREAFGDAYFLLRHEDWLEDAEGTDERLYQHLGIAPDPQVVAWAGANVRATVKETYAGDPRWNRAYDELGMWSALEAAGYESR
jgi:hypothetical protein